jgi:hypothetical protein
MRQLNTTMFVLLLGAGSALAACTSSSTPNEPSTGSSQARVIASNQGSGTTTMQVTATNNASSDVAIDKTIEVANGNATVIDETVVSGAYTFEVDILSGGATAATKSAQITLGDGTTTQIAVAAQTSGATETVQIGVDVAPEITGVKVTTSDAMTQVHVDASDPSNGTLTYYWWGAGLGAPVQGIDTISLSTSAIVAAVSTTSPLLHVVAQDESGASTVTAIALMVTGTNVTGTISTSTGSAAAAQKCLDVQAQCNATCSPGAALGATAGVTVDPTCLAGCSMSLVSCQGE